MGPSSIQLDKWLEINHLLPAATKLGQGNIFTSVCLSTGGEGVCLSACWDMPPRSTPPRPDPLPPTRHPPPGSRPPLEQTAPPEQTPPREADCSVPLTSGRYASYWNAFLLNIKECKNYTCWLVGWMAPG